MVINSFSIIMSIVLFTIISTICSLFLLRTKSQHLWIVALALILCVLRCLIPVEIGGAHNVNIWNIYPAFFTFWETELFWEIRVSELVCILWLCVSLLLLLRQLKAFIHQLKLIRAIQFYPKNERIDRIASKAAEALRCSVPVGVYVTPLSVSPIMTGIFHPIVLIPQSTTELSDVEIEYVLRHEIAHYKGGDIWYKLAIQVLVCFLWWNPAVYLLRRSVGQLLELRCDNRSCESFNQAEKTAYSFVLSKIIENALNAPKNEFSSSFIGNFNGIYSMQRIKILTEKTIPKRSPVVTTLIACICILLYLGSYSFIVQPAYAPPVTDDDDAVMIITPENSWLVPTENGRYEIWVDGVYFFTISENDATQPPYNELPIHQTEENLP